MANEIVVVAVFINAERKLRVEQLLRLQQISSILKIKHRSLLQYLDVKNHFVKQSLGLLIGFAFTLRLSAHDHVDAERASLQSIKEVVEPEDDVILLDVEAQNSVLLDTPLQFWTNWKSLDLEVRFVARPHFLQMKDVGSGVSLPLNGDRNYVLL